MVALNPQTGAILALASYPTFDPNRLATLERHASFVKIDKQLLRDPDQPLLNRAHQRDLPARAPRSRS